MLKPFLGVDSVHLVSSCQVEQVTTWATEKVESHQHEVSEVSKRLGATGRWWTSCEPIRGAVWKDWKKTMAKLWYTNIYAFWEHDLALVQFNYPAIYAQSFTINAFFVPYLRRLSEGFSLRDIDVDMYHASYFNTQMPRWLKNIGQILKFGTC